MIPEIRIIVLIAYRPTAAVVCRGTLAGSSPAAASQRPAGRLPPGACVDAFDESDPFAPLRPQPSIDELDRAELALRPVLDHLSRGEGQNLEQADALRTVIRMARQGRRTADALVERVLQVDELERERAQGRGTTTLPNFYRTSPRGVARWRSALRKSGRAGKLGGRKGCPAVVVCPGWRMAF
jgi:hypothetical protein